MMQSTTKLKGKQYAKKQKAYYKRMEKRQQKKKKLEQKKDTAIANAANATKAANAAILRMDKKAKAMTSI